MEMEEQRQAPFDLMELFDQAYIDYFKLIMSKEVKSKLEKQYDEINNPNKSLEEIEKVSISDYQMKEGDYKVIITVYEAQELEPRPAGLLFFDLNKSAVDGFVEIEVRGETRRTAVRKETNNPIWQQSFFFQFSNLSVQDLDNSKISFNVYDKNNFIIRNSHVGTIELDWTNIYFRRFHQIYRGWLTLSDPNEDNAGSVGFLLVNIAVLGPEDKVMVHDTAFIKDPLTTIEDTITNTKVRLIDYTIVAEIYRAQSLVPLDAFSRNVDAYVVAKFSGNKVRTGIETSLNPEWNEALKLGTGVPNKTKYLLLEVWNRNYFPKKHDLIGTIKIPFIDICENKYNTPRWGHMYGPPMCAVDQPPVNYASKMQLYGEQLGSHYRGRLLFKVVGKKYIRSSNSSTEIKFTFPYKPTPVVALKTYTLSVQLIEGFQLPERKDPQIVVAMGQYLIRSNKRFNIEKRMCEFHYIMEDKKVQFPEDEKQAPDIIIYFCDGPEENNRICFTRIKAEDVKTHVRQKVSDIYELNGDKSLDKLKMFEIGGYINCRVNLYTSAVPSNKSIESDLVDKISFDMHLYIFKGEDFPPAKIEGDCNPMLKFNCFGATAQSSHKMGTFNPFWTETVSISNFNMQDLFTTNLTKGLVVEAFDYIDDSHDQFIGSFLIKINSNNKMKYKKKGNQQSIINKDKPIQFIYLKPRWYYILNPHIEIGKHIFGRVLMSVALFRKDTKTGIPRQIYDFDYREILNKQNKDKPVQKFKKMIEFETRKMQIYVVGLRQIRDTSKKVLTKGDVQLKIAINGKDYDIKMKSQLKRSGCDFNKLIELEVDIPKNKNLVPFIDFKVLHNDKFYGFNSASLYKLLPKLKEKEGEVNAQEDSQETILDVEGLQNQLKVLREKKKREKKEREDKQKNENKEIGIDDEMDVKDLLVPTEMGHTMAIMDGKELDQILAKANLQINSNQFYVMNENLQEQKEQRDSQNIKGDQHVKEEEIPSNLNNSLFDNTFKLEVEEELLGENQEEHLNPGKDEMFSKKSREEMFSKKSREDGPSRQSRTGSESRAGQGVTKIEETVFQKRKKNKPQEKNNTAKITNLLGRKLESGSEKRLSSIKQEKVESNKPQLMEEIPEEREIRAEGSQQSSKLKEKELKGNPAGSQEERDQFMKYANSEEANRDHTRQMQNRFNPYDSRHQDDEESEIKSLHFQARTEEEYEDPEVKERAVVYKDVERVMKQEEKDEKEALEREKEYRFAQAVKLTLFGWTRKKKRRQIETYEDYDSELGEDLDIIPEWYKGRKILTSDFEDLSFKSSKLQTVPLFGGRLLEKTTIYQRYKESAGHVKLICLSEATEVAKEKEEMYTKLLKPREFYCRIYCLKGKSLISHYQGKPTTFLKFYYANEEYSFEKTRLVESENNPEYYICQEIQVNLPGPSVIRIEVIETHDILGKLIQKVLGFTEIDVEQRYFTKKWHLYEKKPIELRNLYSEFGIGSQGRLETWIDLIEKKQWISTPAHKIHPPPFDKYELRVIVYSTDDCVFKNVEMESNDIFVRGVIGTSQPQETDTHWACRSLGSFNYRFKFPVNYPPKPQDMYSDIFAVQIWDRDLIGFNNLIGQTRINMNKIHKIIQKAVKRKKPVKASMKVKERNFAITDRFWFDVYNHKEKDEFGIPQPQGRVQLAFELVPWEQAEEELKNGYGRSEPNVYPTLAEPTGRLQFDFFSPLEFIKQILGPNLYRKWCCRIICCLIILIIALFGYIFFPALIAVKI